MQRRIEFGKQLKALRTDRGYSQERLAELARLHRTYIGGIERGERNVSLENIWRIADALGVNPSHLFAASGEIVAPVLPPNRRSASAAKQTAKKDSAWTRERKR